MAITAQASNAIIENITDWYFPVGSCLEGMYYPGPNIIKLNPIITEYAQKLYSLAIEQNKIDYVIKLDDFIYRGHLMTSISGDVLVLRKIPSKIPKLVDLGFSDQLIKIFLHEKLCAGGLVLITGETGNGKSTTCASIIKSRLEKFNSFCLTVEDPPEFPLHGTHNKGLCYQTGVHNSGFAESLKGAVRCYPATNSSILFVGEIRDSETAAEVLRIASNGNLVFSTVHSFDIISGLRRIISLALGDKNFNESEVKSILSLCLRLVVHQKLIRNDKFQKRLEPTILFSPSGASIMANRIRTSSTEALSTDIQQQQNLILRGEVDKLIEMWDVKGLTQPKK